MHVFRFIAWCVVSHQPHQAELCVVWDGECNEDTRDPPGPLHFALALHGALSFLCSVDMPAVDLDDGTICGTRQSTWRPFCSTLAEHGLEYNPSHPDRAHKHLRLNSPPRLVFQAAWFSFWVSPRASCPSTQTGIPRYGPGSHALTGATLLMSADASHTLV